MSNVRLLNVRLLNVRLSNVRLSNVRLSNVRLSNTIRVFISKKRQTGIELPCCLGRVNGSGVHGIGPRGRCGCTVRTTA